MGCIKAGDVKPPGMGTTRTTTSGGGTTTTTSRGGTTTTTSRGGTTTTTSGGGTTTTTSGGGTTTTTLGGGTTTTTSGGGTTTTIVVTCNIEIEHSPQTNVCTIGGIFPHISVEFRPNQNYLGKFGFDWLHLADNSLTPSEADVLYTDNMGYYNEPDGTKNRTTRSSSFYTGSFISDSLKSTQLANYFESLDTMNAMTTMKTNMQSDFPDYKYRMPVITLMPKDATKNPHNVGVEGALDIIVKTGSVPALSLKLKVRSSYDERILKEAFTFSTNNLPLSSSKNVLKICSKGILIQDVIVYVYTEKCHMPCGAFKLLANINVRKINMVLMGVTTALNPRNPQTGVANIDNMTEVRTLLAQALISVDKVIDTNFDGTPLTLDMTTTLTRRHTLPSVPEVRNSLGVITTPRIVAEPTVFDWAEISNIFNLLETQYQNSIETIYDSTRGSLVSGDAFRFYFLPNKCKSRTIRSGIKGGGAIGTSKTAYFKTRNPLTRAVTIVHEIGHNMGLTHTFNYDIGHGNSYTYRYKSTTNIMDYSAPSIKNVFYHWQWKIMNGRIS